MSKQAKTKKEVTLDDLAAMVQNGFVELRSEFKSDLKKEIGRLDEKIDNLEIKMVEEIKQVKQNTEDIKAELNKKVDRFEHKSLEYRVEKLEKKYA